MIRMAVFAAAMLMAVPAFAQDWSSNIGLTPAQQQVIAAHEALARDPNDTDARFMAETAGSYARQEAAQQQEELDGLRRQRDLDAVGLGMR